MEVVKLSISLRLKDFMKDIGINPILSPHFNFLYLGRWCNGSMSGSNPVGQGSNPWRSAIKILIDFL